MSICMYASPPACSQMRPSLSFSDRYTPNPCEMCENHIHSYKMYNILQPNGVFTPEQHNDKTNVEPVHSYDAFHTRSDMSGVKCIIGMHRFNICLVVVLSVSCSGVKTP